MKHQSKRAGCLSLEFVDQYLPSVGSGIVAVVVATLVSLSPTELLIDSSY